MNPVIIVQSVIIITFLLMSYFIIKSKIAQYRVRFYLCKPFKIGLERVNLYFIYYFGYLAITFYTDDKQNLYPRLKIGDQIKNHRGQMEVTSLKSDINEFCFTCFTLEEDEKRGIKIGSKVHISKNIDFCLVPKEEHITLNLDKTQIITKKYFSKI